MTSLPPDQSTFSLEEVAQHVGVRPYLIRYWESELGAFLPSDASPPREVFLRDDLELLVFINRLVEADGCTIEGVRQRLRANQRGDEISSGDALAGAFFGEFDDAVGASDGDDALSMMGAPEGMPEGLTGDEVLLSSRAATLIEARELIARLQRALEIERARHEEARHQLAAFGPLPGSDGSMPFVEDSFWPVPDPLDHDAEAEGLHHDEPALPAGGPAIPVGPLLLDLPLPPAELPPSPFQRARNNDQAELGRLREKNDSLARAVARSEAECETLRAQLEQAFTQRDDGEGDGIEASLQWLEVERDTLQRQLEEVEAERLTLRRSLDASEETRESLQSQLDAALSERERLEVRLREVAQALEASEVARDEALSERAALQAQLEETAAEPDPWSTTALPLPPMGMERATLDADDPHVLRREVTILERKLDYQASRQRHRLSEIRDQLMGLDGLVQEWK